MAARMICSKQCKSLARQLEQRRWCPGNGSCLLSHCDCGTLRERWGDEHDKCGRRFAARQALSEKKLKAKADKAQAGDFHTKAFQSD